MKTAYGVVKAREASDNPDDYLIVEDPEKKTSWHLQVKDGGTPNHRLMGAAFAALHSGFRGNKYEGPGKAEAIKKLKALYKSEDMEVPAESAEMAEMGDMEMPGVQYVPSGIVSFADLQAAEEVYEATELMQLRLNQFIQMLWNIFYDQTISDKILAMYGLVAEFSALMGGASAGITGAEIAEAVTVKALAKGALKSLSALLEDKSVPDSLRDKITELRLALKKNWADLETDAKDEWGKGKKPPKTEDDDDVETQELASELAECQLSESESGAALLVEADTGQPDLVRMDVRLIKPGWGNSKDNHYYAQETLAAAAERFANAKMYETDHRASEKSTRTWVSTIESAKAAEDGSLIGKVVVHDPSFAARVRNLDAAGHLDLMECSILADGMARSGYQENGRKGKYIESITKVDSVDWVTRAGAGGAALNLSESEQGTNTMGKNITGNVTQTAQSGESTTVVVTNTENSIATAVTTLSTETVTPIIPIILREAQPELPAKLAVEKVNEILGKTRLPKPALARLQEQEWADEPTLIKAIESEIAYIKELTGSGKPFGMGETAASETTRMSESERMKALEDIDRRFGIRN